MDKRVLLPSDYSENALNAIRYAMDLFQHVHCDFYILHVFQVSGYTLESMRVPEAGEPYFEAAKLKAEQGMTKLMEMIKLHPENDKHSFHSIITFNSLTEAVRHLVDQKDIDLIVMGTKGVTESKARIFGTHTVHIMEHIKDCPVIAVPNYYRFEPPKEIVFPTDFKTTFKEKEINHLREVATLYDAKINVLYLTKHDQPILNKKQESNKQLLEDILQGVDFEIHFTPASNVAKGIEDYVIDNGGDMVVFINRKHLFFGSILSNPLVKEIGYDPQVPILELNDN
ncbi:universal stress protein [Flagellimonas zhangzhouensis]|uniref:Nucleotide-binding universal stress protein, UspA family n=1 Tax=Flagellimonas zhangzhouensis TaxID=1073328 RepID=A0A1H2YAD9_9FLAO|nr:universal stress protein [Allomuricauda zhangzhouensis]SDQ98196.1 Nucleotide-binding universal stress protein, UspA family [Allomuricauda zhangzhouensis]SDX01634.1 Nucleotide-binding universal stress protein, UspA family [Allomuricauda zhangzhouensis]